MTGPQRAIAQLDSIRLRPISITGRRDTARVVVWPLGLPEACAVRPSSIEVVIPLEPAITRRVITAVEPPGDASGFGVTPDRVTAVVIAPRARTDVASMAKVRATWSAPVGYATLVGRRVAVHRKGALPAGARVRFEPDSVVVRRLSD